MKTYIGIKLIQINAFDYRYISFYLLIDYHLNTGIADNRISYVSALSFTTSQRILKHKNVKIKSTPVNFERYIEYQIPGYK